MIEGGGGIRVYCSGRRVRETCRPVGRDEEARFVEGSWDIIFSSSSLFSIISSEYESMALQPLMFSTFL
jgi:hypothetical protein